MRGETSKWKIETDAGKMSGYKGRETNDEPFFEIEWLKENFLGEFKGFAKWFEDLDLTSAAVHALI